MKRALSVSFLIIGTVIGAGFASGREIVTFLGERPSPWLALLCGIATFAFCAVFLLVGKKVNASSIGEVNYALCRPLAPIINIFLTFNCVVTFSTMLAGVNSVFSIILPSSPLYSLVFASFSALVVAFGISGLMRVNSIIVPFLIAVIVLICAFSISVPTYDGVTKQGCVSVISYVALNGVLSASVLTTINNLTKKQILLSSAVVGATIGVLVLLISLSLSSSAVSNSDMPIVELSKRIGAYPFIFAIIGLLAGIFTTMITAHSYINEWLNSIFHSRILSVAVSSLLGVLLSFLGFKRVVDMLYPVVGAIGIIYFLICVIYLIRSLRKPICIFTAKCNYRVHNAGKNTKNNGRCHN